MHLTERIDEHRPKRLLALDGGGIRGALTIEVLAGIEELLRAELGAGDDFVLADYFDYVGGTSTGAIIAACIAWGMPVATVRAFYRENAEEMFERTDHHLAPWDLISGEQKRFARVRVLETVIHRVEQGMARWGMAVPAMDDLDPANPSDRR